MQVKYLEFDSKYTEDEKAAAKKVKVACWNNSAQCGIKRKDYETAKKCCGKVLKTDSQNIKSLYRRAQAYIATKDYIEASTDLKNALLYDPNCKEAKLEMRRLAKLQAAVNNKQKKLYSNMFEKMSKMEAADKKKAGLDETEAKEATKEECQAGCCSHKVDVEEEEEEVGCQEGCCSNP